MKVQSKFHRFFRFKVGVSDFLRKGILSLTYKSAAEDDRTQGYLAVFKRLSAFAAENNFKIGVSSA